MVRLIESDADLEHCVVVDPASFTKLANAHTVLDPMSTMYMHTCIHACTVLDPMSLGCSITVHPFHCLTL